jgi:hypothetical protein
MNDTQIADFIFNCIAAKKPDIEWEKELNAKGIDYGVIRRVLDQLILIGRICDDKNSHKGSAYHYFIPIKNITEKNTEPIYKNEEPFEHFHKFLYDFDWLFINSTNKYNKNYLEEPEKVLKLCDKLWDNEISITAKRAQREIENQIFRDNINAPQLINWVESKCTKLKNKASDLIDGQWVERYWVDAHWDQVNGKTINGQWIERHFMDGYAHVAVMPKFIPFFNVTSIMFEFIEWFNEIKKVYNDATTPILNKSEAIPTKANKEKIANKLNGVLSFDDYFEIILEIYNQPRRTVGTYLADKCKELISKNPDFVKYLYKYIYSVLLGVRKEGDLDIIIENGDLVMGYDDFRTKEIPTSLEDALTWLWMDLLKGYVENDPINGLQQLKRFEALFLTENDNAPPDFLQKIAELNKALRCVNDNESKNNIKPQIETENKEKLEPKISLPVVALKYRYLNLTEQHEGITLDNRNRIASTYKWASKSSGRKLHSYYKEFFTEEDRVNPPILIDEAGYIQSLNIRLGYLRRVVKELTAHPKALELAKKELEKASKR